MALPSFFRTPEHRSFEFRPRYYDENKEKREERERNIKRDLGIDLDDHNYTPRLTRGSMRGYINKSRAAQKQSNLRLFVIAGILVLIVYLLFFR